MAKIKELLHDLENYEQLTTEQQKTIREIYNIKKEDVVTLLNTKTKILQEGE